MNRYKYLFLLIICVIETFHFGCFCSIWAQEFKELFNKQDLRGWEVELSSDDVWADNRVAANWAVRNQILEASDAESLLRTSQSFGDCELTIEWRARENADGFVSIRNVSCLPLANFAAIRPENLAQLSSLFGADGLQRLKKAAKPFGDWNRYDLKLVGQCAEVSLNGRKIKSVIDLSPNIKSLTLSAPIFLGSNKGQFSLRTFKLRPIDSGEANEFLSHLNRESFHSIFNGQDFSGWTGALDDFEIINETMANKQGFHGDIFTTKSYGDFVVRLQFKLPPAGNSGLALRYQGEGDPHVGGMCELQVLDSEHPTYANLDPRQYHGSPYGIAAAKRGFLRKTGEWNFQEVTVLGSKIKAQLNGFTILCVDLNDYHETKDGPLHDLINVATGHFGIASHLDPVAFRQLSIRELLSADETIDCP